MTLPPVLQRAVAAARMRQWLSAVLITLPWLALAFALAWRLHVPLPWLAFGLVAVAATTIGAWRSAHRMDARWFARQLDRRADMQDSADLLFVDTRQLSGLQVLQHERLLKTLGRAPPDLRPAWPSRWIATSLAIALALAAAVVLWPGAKPLVADLPPGAAAPAAVATDITLVAATLTVTPPAYTALPARDTNELSAKAPENSQLRWRLRLSPQPASAELVFHDGERVALAREGDDWTATRLLSRSTLYRVVPGGPLPLRDQARHRLDAIPDQPPQVRVIAPERSLTAATPDQRTWALSFEASDDHGLGGARLGLTLAQGSGEQVTVTERSLVLQGEGDGKQRRYVRNIDLKALGLGDGDDLIVRLVVSDNRAPSPQSSRSTSLILRWPPPPSAESSGMEGLVKKTLPAYFRSQRQIIIDAQALVAERPRLAADKFMQRSDSLGVDQRILRMRYGQFLGEETEGEPEPPPSADGEQHSLDDGHDHGSEPPTTMGAMPDVMEDFGHTHDDSEAATLLDPETRELLRKALNAMWLSEGELRGGRPAQALPHAYRALGFIKQVQQASRIYLARVGLELPPIDEARRMTGDRAGLGDRRTGLVPAAPPSSPALALWRSLAATGDSAAERDAFATWLRANETTVDDPLGLVAALDALASDPACDACRQELRRKLWPLLATPAAAAASRSAPDARGAAYLDALARERSP
ncbi:MAG: DUF4175 domain-containing protein [Arenimonas sp.]|uniref:hypothetical protein n=1 Tax=Arenimonas sp. TaxID=1872635 RepID=UPI0025BE6118|nr:hypothetical protein [Arenimonas sp.]MBW8368795.1 DUF4175 domain-containing protein [Arenimonas sp.]